MDFYPVLLAEANELHLGEEVVDALHHALKPVLSCLQEASEFGVYYYSEARCVEACNVLNESVRAEAVVLLWKVAQELREYWIASVPVESRVFQQVEVETKVSISATVHLQDLRLFGSGMQRPVSNAVVNKLKNALNKRHQVCRKIKKEAVGSGKSVSPEVKVMAVRTKVQGACHDILCLLGPLSERYIMLYGDGTRVPSEKEREYVCKLFFQSQGRLVEPLTVYAYSKEFNKFVEWLTSIAVPFGVLNSFHVATWLHDMSGRGKSVPSRCLASLVWASSVFLIDLFVTDDGVKMEGKSSLSKSPPVPARCPSIALVVQLEEIVVNEMKTDVIRCIAGYCCVLAHGCLRWKDFQSADNVQEAADAILGSSYMKHQGVRSWAALKKGFSGVNWGSSFFALLRKFGMPAEGFVLLCPTSDMKGFRERAASFSDALHAMRFLLVVELGMSPEDACTYSLHSWRHVMITAGRQLPNPLSKDQQTEVGHWVTNSSMPRSYDAVASSVEMQAKKRVVDFFQDGREMLAPGELHEDEINSSKRLRMLHSDEPRKGEVSPSDGVLCEVKSPSLVGVSSASTELSCGVVEQTPSGVKAGLGLSGLLSPVQVEHEFSRRLHLYHPEIQRRGDEVESVRAVCGHWKCGTPKHPVSNASFYVAFDTIPLVPASFELDKFEPCGRCFSVRVIDGQSWTPFIPDKDSLMKRQGDMSGTSSCSIEEESESVSG